MAIIVKKRYLSPLLLPQTIYKWDHKPSHHNQFVKFLSVIFPQLCHIVLQHQALKYIAPNDIFQELESMRRPKRTREENRDLKRVPRSRLSTSYTCTLCEKECSG